MMETSVMEGEDVEDNRLEDLNIFNQRHDPMTQQNLYILFLF